MKDLPPEPGYLIASLLRLLEIPSPSGYTDGIVRHVSEELESIGAEIELTRRGAIRATLRGASRESDRAIVSHLDTLGALVKELKDNGRMRIAPIGHWSARFAEGARVTLFTDEAAYRGTVLPLKASGHTFNEEVNTLPVGWEYVELRIDEDVSGRSDLERLGVNIGDIIAFDPLMEIEQNGFINARHLDDKAGAAAMLAAAKTILESKVPLPVDCHLLFTISEEVGSGASAILHGDVAEMVSVDNGTVAPGQASKEFGVTIAMSDSTGPFDYHLTRHLIGLCRDHGIQHQRDVFRYYRSDSATAVEAGNDIRTALITFGIDASHGYERTNIDAVASVARLLVVYMQSAPLFRRERQALAPLKGFPDQPVAMPDVERH
ncbi:MAG TPA: osmoprotectant NAGGN system M42 family peptidase [Alphaproteobacteria bacterium]